MRVDDLKEILKASYLYALVLLLIVNVGDTLEFKSLYESVFVTEFFLILIPVIVFTSFESLVIEEVFSLKKLEKREVFICAVVSLCTSISIVFLNSVLNVKEPHVLLSGVHEFSVFSIILFVFSPSICEEALFRGILYSAFKRIGKKKAAVVISIMFSVSHLNLGNSLGLFLLSIVFVSLLEKTRSIYSCVISHSVNNILALLIYVKLPYLLTAIREMDILVKVLVFTVLSLIVYRLIRLL